MAQQDKQPMQVMMTPEVAKGNYSNFSIISHGPSEFFVDFLTMGPNMPQPQVQTRIIITPENAKNLLAALADNIHKYEETFGEIKPRTPRRTNGNGGGTNGEIHNPFMNSGKA